MSSWLVSVTNPDRLDVTLRGEIDFTSVAEIQAAIRTAVARECPAELRVNLAEVTFFDSSGIGMLVAARRTATEVGARFRVNNPNPRILNRLQLMGLAAAFGLK